MRILLEITQTYFLELDTDSLDHLKPDDVTPEDLSEDDKELVKEYINETVIPRAMAYRVLQATQDPDKDLSLPDGLDFFAFLSNDSDSITPEHWTDDTPLS